MNWISDELGSLFNFFSNYRLQHIIKQNKTRLDHCSYILISEYQMLPYFMNSDGAKHFQCCKRVASLKCFALYSQQNLILLNSILLRFFFFGLLHDIHFYQNLQLTHHNCFICFQRVSFTLNCQVKSTWTCYRIAG